MTEKLQQLKELQTFGIKPAGKREWIPVEGLSFPKVDAAHNLSAGLQQVSFPYVAGTQVTVRSQSILSLLTQRLEAAAGTKAYLFAVASDNDTLYEQVVVPTVNAYLKDNKGTHMLIPSVGYPLIDWWKEGLEKAGNSLVEADYFALMKKGKLPESVKAVYIDFPGTFFSASYSPVALKAWIQANPDVLFVVDQANLGFFTKGQQAEEAYNLFHALPPQKNLLLTNTTTKASSVRVIASAWAPKEFAMQYGSSTSQPITKRLSIGSMQQAAQLFHPLNLAKAAELRATIVGYREYLKSVLKEKYGAGAVFNSNATEGHALILNSKAFGYPSGEDFSRALANGSIPIGVKSTKYYTDTSRNGWVADYVYVSIPFDVQVMNDLCKALGVKEVGA